MSLYAGPPISIGRNWPRKSFVARFRLVARKFLYFQKRVSKLGPGYYGCNERQSSCTRRNAQPREGCPNCEFTIQNTEFKKELDSELKYLKNGTWVGEHKWPSKKLLPMVIEIGSIANSIEGVSPTWPVVTLTLISIYREEQGKIKAVENWNLTQDKVSNAETNAAKVRQMAQQAATAGTEIPSSEDEWEID